MFFPSKNDHLDESICCCPKKNMIIIGKPWKTNVATNIFFLSWENHGNKHGKTNVATNIFSSSCENHGKKHGTKQHGKPMLKPTISWLILGWFPLDHPLLENIHRGFAAWSHRALWPQGFDLGHAPGPKRKMRPLKCGANV